MATVFVQFSDSTESTVGGWFGAPQSAGSYPNSAEIDTSDPRWSTYYAVQSASAQEMMPAPGA